MSGPGQLPSGYFDAMYADNKDPWGFASRWYERRKYDLTMAALPRPRYRLAFEPGCSIGVLTVRLAERCDALLASDVTEVALAQARARVASLPHVRVEAGSVPADWPDGRFDLIVVSEIGYYFRPEVLAQVLDRACAALEPGGHLLGVHWRPAVDDYLMTGDEVHDMVRQRPELERVVGYAEARFRLDVMQRRPS